MSNTPALRSVQAAGQVREVQEATGDLSASATSTPISCHQYNTATIYLNITTLTMDDTADEMDFYFQTTYDNTNYVDMENVHFANDADGTTPKRVLTFGMWEALAADTAVTPTDGGLADNTKLKLPLGSKFRIKAVITDATGSAMVFAYVATGVFR